MSRDELATAVNEWLHEHFVLDSDVDGTYIGKLERGVYRWPTKTRREALRVVLSGLWQRFREAALPRDG